MILFLRLQPKGSVLSAVQPVEPAWAQTRAAFLSGYNLTKINGMSGYNLTKNKFMKEYHELLRYTASLMAYGECIIVTSEKIWGCGIR